MGGEMKRFVVISLLIVVMLSGVSYAAESPVALNHTLASSLKDADSITLNFVLHIKNLGATPLYKLKLEYVPLIVFATEEIILKVERIEANGTIDIPFAIITSMTISEEGIIKQPLFWAGEGMDANNNFLEFPAESLFSN
jgi:hypothetical protein